MTHIEINEFLASFNNSLYNRSQIGNSKQTMMSVYEYLFKLNINKEDIDIIISNIAYLNKDKINIPLYLELLSKSYGFISTYSLKDIIKVIKEIHDIYYKSSSNILLEEYLHDTNEIRIKKLFLNRNNKYLIKNFETPESLDYISDLKLASAIALSSKEYNEFINYIDNFEKYQDSYSPLIIFKTYSKVRKNLKENSLVFWDILFGNEYVVALTKHNIEVKDIYKKNIYSNYKRPKSNNKQIPIQLDLFSYLSEEEPKKDISSLNNFQICTIYNSNELPEFNKEKDLLMYYKNLLDNKDIIILPKLKNQSKATYIYEIN